MTICRKRRESDTSSDEGPGDGATAAVGSGQAPTPDRSPRDDASGKTALGSSGEGNTCASVEAQKHSESPEQDLSHSSVGKEKRDEAIGNAALGSSGEGNT